MKNTKRILSILLACLMVLSSLPLAILAVEPKAEPSAQAEINYNDLYVKDADDDKEDDRIFFWDAFDLKAGDGSVTALQNQLANGGSVALSSGGTAGDGYVASLSTLNFSTYFQSFAKTVDNVLVLQDSTWEMVIFQNTTKSYADSDQAFIALVPLNFLKLDLWAANGDQQASFLKETYGEFSSLAGVKATVTFDGAGNAYNNTVILGNTRGANHTFTYAVRHDFDVADGEIDGTLTLDFMRDGKIAANSSRTTSYKMLYDARYRGHFNNVASPTAAANTFSFGGADFAYRAIRIYDVALDEAEMAQNHAADLFKYYKIDVTDYLKLDASAKATVHEALRTVQIGDAGAKMAVKAVLKAYASSIYDDLYVKDADGDTIDDRIFFWDAFDLEAGDGSVTALQNQLANGGSVALSGTAGDGYVATLDKLNFSSYFQSFAKKVNDVLVLQDSTWEILMFQNTTQTYADSAETFIALAPFNNFKLDLWAANGDQQASFMKETYAEFSSPTGSKANVSFDGAGNAYNNTVILGNTRGADYTFTYAVRHDFDVADGEISGTLALDFMRDGKVSTNSSRSTSYKMLYDARYRGPFNNVASPNAAANTFSFGGADFAYRAIRIYDVALTDAQMAQNHFVDIARQLSLDIEAYATCENALLKSAIHDLTLGHDSADFEKAELQTQVDNILKVGTEEYNEILTSDALYFDGYAIRVLGDAGLRSVFTLDLDFIEATKANELVQIKEIGAIVAIKGDYELEDLTVAGGRQMMKNAVYANGEFEKNAQGDPLTYVRQSDEKTCFALTTLYDTESAKTADRYKTELLYRGYIIVSIGENESVIYVDMTAPSFEKISMYDVTKVFEANGYANTQTVKDVLAVCEPKA